jgi:hypothetical protein
MFVLSAHEGLDGSEVRRASTTDGDLEGRTVFETDPAVLRLRSSPVEHETTDTRNDGEEDDGEEEGDADGEAEDGRRRELAGGRKGQSRRERAALHATTSAGAL